MVRYKLQQDDANDVHIKILLNIKDHIESVKTLFIKFHLKHQQLNWSVVYKLNGLSQSIQI
jgi:hypothetical protein